MLSRAVRLHRAAPVPVQRWGFRCMGMDIVLNGPVATGGRDRRAFAAAASTVEREFRLADARFSRFREDSELSRVNAGAGRWQLLSPPFAELLRRSLDAARATQGLFDPTILPALVAAGYDRDFDEVVGAPRRPHVPRVLRARPVRWSEVELDGRMVFLPQGAALDFGGIAKGWAVDRAVDCIREIPWAVVDAGGDLRIAGHPEEPVRIAVAHPMDAGVEIARIGLEGGALATSSVVGRTWGPGLHHVIDPRTWRPARTAALQSTVWADTCTEAEIIATWALLRGPRSLRELPGILAMRDGRVLVSMSGTVAAEAAAC